MNIFNKAIVARAKPEIVSSYFEERYDSLYLDSCNLNVKISRVKIKKHLN